MSPLPPHSRHGLDTEGKEASSPWACSQLIKDVSPVSQESWPAVREELTEINEGEKKKRRKIRVLLVFFISLRWWENEWSPVQVISEKRKYSWLIPKKDQSRCNRLLHLPGAVCYGLLGKVHGRTDCKSFLAAGMLTHQASWKSSFSDAYKQAWWKEFWSRWSWWYISSNLKALS